MQENYRFTKHYRNRRTGECTFSDYTGWQWCEDGDAVEFWLPDGLSEVYRPDTVPAVVWQGQGITSFRGEYAFLSNFSPFSITIFGQRFSNAEAAFQSQKTEDAELQTQFAELDARSAKAKGKTVLLRSDWEDIKEQIMLEVVRAKFSQNDALRHLLLRTGDAYLVEGNTWHDNYWGVCRCDRCKGIHSRNELGQILMRVRMELRDRAIEEKTKSPAAQLSGREIQPGDFTIDHPRGGDIQFMENCMPDGNDGLNILLFSNCDVDEVLGTHVETTENEDWVNIYINISEDYTEISPVMEVMLNRGDGSMEEMERPLNEREQAVLLNMAQRFELQRLQGLVADTQRKIDG